MDINKWGPALWELIHTTAYNYRFIKIDDNMKKHYINFFNMMSVLIPCPNCQGHYRQYLAQNPIKVAVNSYDQLINWVNNLHNNVNSRNNKNKFSLDDSRNKYISDDRLNIDYGKLYDAMDALFSSINSYNFETYRVLINSLRHIYPCEKSRRKLNDYCNKNFIIYNNYRVWYSKLNIRTLHH